MRILSVLSGLALAACLAFATPSMAASPGHELSYDLIAASVAVDVMQPTPSFTNLSAQNLFSEADMFDLAVVSADETIAPMPAKMLPSLLDIGLDPLARDDPGWRVS